MKYGYLTYKPLPSYFLRQKIPVVAYGNEVIFRLSKPYTVMMSVSFDAVSVSTSLVNLFVNS